MALTLKQSHAISDAAQVLYDFLPGSGSKAWTGHITFASIAESLGVGSYWQKGSKLPAITNLLRLTLDQHPEKFEKLVLEIVRSGIIYREKKGEPIQAEEITTLNGHLVDVGFKFPDLWDPAFLDSLRLDSHARAQAKVDEALQREEQELSAFNEKARVRDELLQEFISLPAEATPQAAGFKFEKILNSIFELEGLKPRPPFRVCGEQIDGSFELDHETYLVEAKWEKAPSSEGPLLIFKGKIEGKSKYTRGVFICLNGITNDAHIAIGTGKERIFFVLNGHDMIMVLSGHISLADFLRVRRRLLAEEGRVVVPFHELQIS